MEFKVIDSFLIPLRALPHIALSIFKAVGYWNQTLEQFCLTLSQDPPL